MVDEVNKWSPGNITSPAYSYASITPSDTVDDPIGPFKSIYVGGPGTVVAVRLDGTAVAFVGVVAGTTLPVIARRVNNTNTTASSMIGLK